MVGVRWVGERRVLRRASHQSLKVPVFRDQSFDALSRNDPAITYARGDWDADYRRSEGNEGWGTVDLERPTSSDRQDGWETADAEDTGPLPVVREASPSAPVPLEDDSWDARPHHTEHRLGPPAPGPLTFKPVTRPWYGSSQRLLMFLVGAAVIAMIVAGVLLVLRDSDTGTDETTTVTPTATTGATPQPAVPPNTVGDGLLPPGVPGDVPPPPPPEVTSAPPPATGGGYRWRPTQDPDEGSTLRPRNPPTISVAPTPRPRQAPAPGHSAPGDAPRRHRGFF